MEKRKKKKLDQIIIPYRHELLEIISAHTETNAAVACRDKSLACFLYLTAARINEVVNVVRKKDIEFAEHKGYKLIIVHNVPCLKRRIATIRRTIPILLTDSIEPFWRIFYTYLNTIPNDNDVVYPMSRINAYKRIRRICDEWYPHFFRHCRLTHMTISGISVPMLKQFTGWTSIEPANSYIHTAWEDVANAMLLDK